MDNNSKQYQKVAASSKKEPKVKPKKVVKGNVKTVKKSEFTKLSSIFISEDINNVKSFVFLDVLVPAIKKAVYDIVTNGIDMILYGGTGSSINSRSRSGGSSFNYSGISSRKNDRVRDDSRSRTRFDYDDLKFETRSDAEAVLAQMDEVVDCYGFVTVAAMYDMADKTAPYTANNYGWTNIRSAEVVRVRDGYIIKLPRYVQID